MLAIGFARIVSSDPETEPHQYFVRAALSLLHIDEPIGISQQDVQTHLHKPLLNVSGYSSVKIQHI
jgi:hypothetical protein